MINTIYLIFTEQISQMVSKFQRTCSISSKRLFNNDPRPTSNNKILCLIFLIVEVCFFNIYNALEINSVTLLTYDPCMFHECERLFPQIKKVVLPNKTTCWKYQKFHVWQVLHLKYGNLQIDHMLQQCKSYKTRIHQDVLFRFHLPKKLYYLIF